MLPQCLELNFKNGIFLERTVWSFLEMSHVKQDHQWAVGSGLPGVSFGNGGWWRGKQGGKGNKNRVEGKQDMTKGPHSCARNRLRAQDSFQPVRHHGGRKGRNGL